MSIRESSGFFCTFDFHFLPFMYTPDRYKKADRKELLEFIRKNPFGILVISDGKKPVATHIPLMLREENGEPILIGHISKENEQGNLFHDSTEVLAIFQGPHTYISSSWYSHENVSTWNYIAVHAYGKISVMTELELVEHLILLTNHFEAGSEKPKYFENISPQVVRENITGIIGFKMTLEKIQANFKLSQNRNKADHSNIIHELEKRGDTSSQSVADEMKKHGHQL
ncbi:protease synthase/sporulation negative transcriptional regulator PaiB [soil metagenome]